MRKRFKRLMLIILTGIISIFVLILSVSFINHKIQLSKEEELFVPTGQLVEINSHQMHVYTEGNGEETLVFMSVGGTSSPVLDFKLLYSLLIAIYNIILFVEYVY